MKQGVPTALAAVFTTLLLPGAAMAADGVTEARPSYIQAQQDEQDEQPPQSGRDLSPGNSDGLSLLLQQISELRQEVVNLRSMVEEQAYELRRLRRTSQDRYEDLDSRVSTLYQEGAAATVSSGGDSPAQDGSDSSQSSSGAASAINANRIPVPGQDSSGDGQSVDGQSGDGQQSVAVDESQLPDPSEVTEQQLYQNALDTLLQQENYRQSIAGFDQYLENYPDGRFVTNAHYWKGQAYVNLSELEQARDEFATVVNDYPDGRKVDDSMYSLGTVENELGNPERARELLQEVMSRFPNTSAANLADIYLRSL